MLSRLIQAGTPGAPLMMRYLSNRSWGLIAVFVIGVCVQATVVRAECPSRWKRGQGMTGFNGIMYMAYPWDPDGTGPLASSLVVGGTFTVAGDTYANYIAVWNGVTWQPMGVGLGSTVYSAAVFNGDLIVAGFF